MPFLDRPDARVHYEVWEPEGPPRGFATLLNGHTRTLNDLRMMGRALTERGFTVAAVDSRGAGETDAEGPFTLDGMAADVVALWDALGWQQSDLVGLSMGGMIAFKIVLSAAGAPRTRRLALVSTGASRELVKRDTLPQTPEEIEATLLEHFSPQFVEKQQFLLRAFTKEMARAFQDPRRAAGAAAQRAAMQNYDVVGDLGRISVPTLVVHGERDRVMPPAAAEVMARAIPGARLVLLADAGHLLLAEAPRRLYDVVTDFLVEERE